MRRILLMIAIAGCSSPAKPQASVPAPADPVAAPSPAAAPPPGPAEPAPEKLAADSPKTTVAGNAFIAPGGWTLRVRGAATILEAPEGGSYIAIHDLSAPKDADAAVAAAWALYKPGAVPPFKAKIAAADRDGWTDRWSYDYVMSPNARRDVGVDVRRANGVWTVSIFDMAQDVGEKRGAQVGLIFGKFLPKGRDRETFAGKEAQILDATRLAALSKFVEDGMKATGVPGVSVGIVQGGKVVFAGGFGVRELGKPAKVDGDTKFMIASNTKALATLMIAKLVDSRKLDWETTATSLLPSFKLGNAETTAQVLVKHLICACTGLPRQDMEWLLEYKGLTPAKVMETLGTMQPTSKFGELFQYSNPLAAAAGFIGGHVAYPKLELGAAYDKAMQTLVFDPLGMTSTTFDFAKGQKGNAAVPHAPDVDGKPEIAIGTVNRSVIALRPAGGAWSNVKDMLKYVQMELSLGALPNARKPYINREALLARRAPQVAIGATATYGMGLMVDTTYGVTVVHHGGDMIGFHSDMLWLPEHNVGAVILTSGDPGWQIRSIFQRKLLEVLFDGRNEADAQMAAQSKAFFTQLAADRALLTVPADAATAKQLAPRYQNAALGEIAVKTKGAATTFDFGEYASEVATRKNPDGTMSFITIVPGMNGLEFVVGAAGKRTLTLRDPQHEYVFTEQ